MKIHYQKPGAFGRIRQGAMAGGYVSECGRDFKTDAAVTRERDAVTCENCLRLMREGGDFAPVKEEL